MSDPREIIRKGKAQASQMVEDAGLKIRYLRASVALAKKMGEPVAGQEAALTALEEVIRNLRKASAAFGVD